VITILGLALAQDDKLTENFLNMGNAAERSGGQIPNWDQIKNADQKLLKESLHSIKDEKKIGENEIDKLYASTCIEFVQVSNTQNIAESDITHNKEVYCNKLNVNLGDHLLDVDLGKVVLWNLIDFLGDKNLDLRLETQIINQQGVIHNDSFKKSFGDMNTRCLKKDADCSPSSSSRKNSNFMDKYGSIM